MRDKSQGRKSYLQVKTLVHNIDRILQVSKKMINPMRKMNQTMNKHFIEKKANKHSGC